MGPAGPPPGDHRLRCDECHIATWGSADPPHAADAPAAEGRLFRKVEFDAQDAAASSGRRPRYGRRPRPRPRPRAPPRYWIEARQRGAVW